MALVGNAPRKQEPAMEVSPTDDDPRLEKVARAMPSPAAKTPAGQPKSVWDNWVAAQMQMAENPLSMKDRASSRRTRSARSDLDANRSNSALATGSGFTNTGRKATEARVQELVETAEAEEQEVEDLKELLGRTLYTGGGNSYKRAGSVATSSLMKLSDGQNDDIVTLRKRRIAEEHAASVSTGRPPWDSSVHKATPPALKGSIPVTPEPWVRDALAYDAGMSGHGFKSVDTGVEDAGYKKSKKVQIHQQNAAATIQRDMVAYRRELGAEKKAPVSARHLRAWSDAGSIPVTPKTVLSGRTTGRSTGRVAAARKRDA